MTSVVYKCSIHVVCHNELVSDADREIPTISKPCFRHYPFTLGFGFLYLHRRLMIDSICLAYRFVYFHKIELHQESRQHYYPNDYDKITPFQTSVKYM